MKVAIIGPGAIGCLFAAKMALSGIEVFLLDKTSKRAALLSRSGIILKEPSGKKHTIKISVITDPKSLFSADFICICVKAYDTESVIENAGIYMHGKTIVSFQNGMGNIEKILAKVPDIFPVCALTAQGAISEKPGYVFHAGTGKTLVSPFLKKAATEARNFATILSKSGFPVSYSKNPVKTLWKKLIINSAINPVTAIWKIRNGEVLANKEAIFMARKAAFETAEVARKKGVKLLPRDPWKMVAEVCKLTAQNKSSMLLDILRRKKTEIDSINGYVCKMARQLRISVPINTYFVRKIHQIENKYLKT